MQSNRTAFLEWLARLKGVHSLGIVAAFVLTGLLGIVGGAIYESATRLRNAPNPFHQWTMAQLEVDLLRLTYAVDAAYDEHESLDEVRRRFDVFYSRVHGISRGRIRADLEGIPDTDRTLRLTHEFLDRTAPLIDADDATLTANLKTIMNDAVALFPPVRDLAMDAARGFTAKVDARRADFEELLITASLFAGGMILLLLLSLGFLFRHWRVSEDRAEELAQSRERLAATIDASLDAIVASDAAGRIIEFNEAASRIFGLDRDAAIGRNLAEMLVPTRFRHSESLPEVMQSLALGDATGRQQERRETRALRADGTEFPIELSLGMTRSKTGPILIAYIRDISERLRAELALKAARDEAMAADRAKSEFIAVMSHEMRTPLNGMLGVLDLLAQTGLNRRQQRYVNLANRSGNILLGHINNVLDISRIGAGHMSFASRPFDLKALVESVIEINYPVARARGLRLLSEIADPGGALLGDSDRISQVLMNLIGNAVKFTHKGLVTVRLAVLERTEESTRVEISVVDTGPGIGEEDIGRIFDDFVTLDTSYDRENSGSGLGLAITRRLVTAMGGDLGVESTVGKGSRFWTRLTLPNAIAAAAADDAACTGPSPARPAHPLLGLRALVVEDNEVNRIIAREMLEHSGLKVDEARDGAEGLWMALKTKYDVILMDISMPVLDGIEVTRRIRNQPGPSRQAPIIGVTAHVLPEEQARFAEAGMQNVIAKPVRLNAILTLLAEKNPPPEPAVADEEDEHALLDLDILAAMAEDLPADRVTHLLNRASADIGAGLRALADASSASDLGTVATRAHRLAGTAAMIGATRLHSRLCRIEAASKRSDLAATTGEVEALVRDVAETQRLISDFSIAAERA